MDDVEKAKTLKEIHYLRCSVRNRQHLLEQDNKTNKFKFHHQKMIDFEIAKIIELENKFNRG